MLTTRHRGFTLIELMIVVTLIGILAAIVYPSYTGYTRQTRRSDAQIALTDLASRMEKFYADCNHYAAKFDGAARACAVAADLSDGTHGLVPAGATHYSPDRHYALTISAATVACPRSSCFEIVADPNAVGTTGRQQNDGKLRINSVGNKQWDKKNDNNYGYKWTDK